MVGIEGVLVGGLVAAACLWAWFGGLRLRVGIFLALLAFSLGLLCGAKTGWTVAFLSTALYILLGTPYGRRPVMVRLLSLLKVKMPVLSEAERLAVLTGEAGPARLLFARTPSLFEQDTPHVSLSVEERLFLETEVAGVCQRIQDWEVRQQHDLPKEIWATLRDKGFFGLALPTEWGGKGFSATAHRVILQHLASTSGTLASTVAVPNSLGPGELLVHAGTEDQRAYYLPRLAAGSEIPCFGLTSLLAGSDAASLLDEAVICRAPPDLRCPWEEDSAHPETKEEADDCETPARPRLALRVNARKRYITLAPIATLLGLAVRIRDPEGLLGAQEDLGLALLLLPRDTHGVSTGARHRPSGTPFQNGPLVVEDALVPLEMIIGGAEGIGKGWAYLLSCLAIGRGISLPAMSSAGAQVAALTAGSYTRLRRQFGKPLLAFEAVQEHVSTLFVETLTARAWAVLSTDTLDAGQVPPAFTAMAKYVTTEASRVSVQHAMDVLGGKAVMEGPSNPLSGLWAGAPIAITVEGANLLTRSVMVIGQGLLTAHPTLRAVYESVQKNASDDFDAAVLHLGCHAACDMGTVWKGRWNATYPAALDRSSKEEWKRRALQISTRLTSAFHLALLSAVGRHGGGLKRQEHLTGALADGWMALLSLHALERLARAVPDAQVEQAQSLRRLAVRVHLQRATLALHTLFTEDAVLSTLLGGVQAFPLPAPPFMTTLRSAARTPLTLLETWVAPEVWKAWHTHHAPWASWVRLAEEGEHLDAWEATHPEDRAGSPPVEWKEAEARWHQAVESLLAVDVFPEKPTGRSVLETCWPEEGTVTHLPPKRRSKSNLGSASKRA